MKNCDEMVNSLFERRERYAVEQKKKRTIITRTVASMCCVCFIAILGVGLLQGRFFNSHTPTPDVSGKNNDLLIETSGDDLSNVPSYVILWKDAVGAEDSAIMQMNGKNISYSLSDTLNNAPENSRVAIIARPITIDQNFIYKGKSIAEYQEEATAEKQYIDKLAYLLKVGDSLKYGESLYQTGSPKGEKWSQSLYEETVETIGEDLLSKYIVNGVFLKKSLEADMEVSQGLAAAQRNYDLAYASYCKQVVTEVKKILDEKNVEYDKSSDTDCDYVIIFATEKEFSNLSFQGIENWQFGFASKNNEKGQDFLTDENSIPNAADISS